MKILSYLFLFALSAAFAVEPAPHTSITLRDGRWFINGQITNPGSVAEGLLMNVRMVNAVFEDRGKPEFDPAANTDRLIAHIPDYAAHGVNALTLCLQGGMPGYERAVNSAFEPDGKLREAYLQRVERVIRACDERGMAVILGLFYQRQSKILKDDEALRAGVVNAVNWVQARGFKNVLVEIANEYPHKGFAHELIRKPSGVASLIRLAKQTTPDLLVSASGYGDGKIHPEVAEASDFLLPHWNGTGVDDIPARIAVLKKFNKPIVCNEDDKTGADAVAALQACVKNGASYGLMLENHNQRFPFHFDGAADDAVYYAALQAATARKTANVSSEQGGSKLEALRVGDGGHFLVNASGKPVFLLADTAWGLISRLKREEITKYLEHRHAQGFNAVTFVLYSPGNPDIADGSRNAYGHAPFAMKGDKPDPTRSNADYWAVADFAMAEAARLGLYAVVLPCWGSAVVGEYSGKPSNDQIFDAASAHDYGRWLGERYKGQSNLLWMLGGDRQAVYGERDFRPVFRALAQGLRDGGATQLASFHPPKRAPQSGDWFHADPWLGFNSIQQWPEDQIASVTRDWQAQPAKPTWIFEGRYEGYWKSNYKPEDWGEWQCRQQVYQSVFAGGFGFTYGHERVFGFGKDGADWRSFLDAPGARCTAYLAKLMATWPDAAALSRVPDQSLIGGDEGKAGRRTSDRLTAARSGDGSLAMIYSANGRSIRVRMDQLAGPAMDASWFDPRTGDTLSATERITSGKGAVPHDFEPLGKPANGNDWVLVLRTAR